MTSHPRGPLEGVERLVVDGTNLLHQLGRSGAAPPATLIGRIRGAVPAHVFIDLVFDGGDDGPKGRVATAMHVRFAGRRSADDLILDIVSAETRGLGQDEPRGILVVTDDRELRLRLQAIGVTTARSHWLISRIDMPVRASVSVGNARPPAGIGHAGAAAGAGGSSGASPSNAAQAERTPWQPGRGATSKHGPAKKVARHKRHPRMGQA